MTASASPSIKVAMRTLVFELFGRLERALDPIDALRPLGWIHLLGRILLPVDEGELSPDRLGLRVDGGLDCLVALTNGEPDRPARSFEGNPLECSEDLLLTGGGSTALGFLVSRLEPEEGLRHVVRRIVGR